MAVITAWCTTSNPGLICQNSAASFTQTDVYMTGRTNGVATYHNSDFFGLVDGLHFALQYQGNNENAGSRKTLTTVVLVNWRGKMATGLAISLSYTISIWASASGQPLVFDRYPTNQLAARVCLLPNG